MKAAQRKRGYTGTLTKIVPENQPMTPKKTIWLLSAYRADSHAAWADWLIDNHPSIEWQRLELPGRHFRWRIRGNPLSWLDVLPQQTPDLILATSMVDLATLKGLHPRLAQVPAYYYFHENQFAYPVSEHQARSIEPQMVQLYGALAADRLLFNSDFNRDSFLDGVEALLNKMPDETPADIRQRLQKKSAIYPVPVNPVATDAQKDLNLILWNHRWEYDKAPELFVEAMVELARQGSEFKLALLGARGVQTPPALSHLREKLADQIVVDEKVDSDQYRQWLGKAGIVISTSLHEFQGLSVLEAASANARPLVPDALCYPEQYPAKYRYPAGDKTALVEKLNHWLNGDLPNPVDVSNWYQSNLSESWQLLLEQNINQ